MNGKKSGPLVSFSLSGTGGEPNNKVIRARSNPDYQGSFVVSASRCRKLAWRLAAVDARELLDLEVDFDEPLELWLQHCKHSGPILGRVNLGVYTGSVSGLVVLEVENGEGETHLDLYGSWRSSCRASLSGREQHYYILPAKAAAPPTWYVMAARVMVFGEEGLAPLPPSLDVHNRQSWRWVTPPWEHYPSELPPCLLPFLEQHLSRRKSFHKHYLTQSAKEGNFPPNPLPHWGKGKKMNLLNAPGKKNRGGEKINGHLFSHETLLQAWPARSPYPGKHDDNIFEPSPEAGFDDAGSPLNLVGPSDLDEIPGEQSRSINQGQSGKIIINYQ